MRQGSGCFAKRYFTVRADNGAEPRCHEVSNSISAGHESNNDTKHGNMAICQCVVLSFLAACPLLIMVNLQFDNSTHVVYDARVRVL